jgi:hypothetical protein
MFNQFINTALKKAKKILRHHTQLITCKNTNILLYDILLFEYTRSHQDIDYNTQYYHCTS